MTGEHSTDSGADPPITELSARQRRVLGVLVEKAYTTPEYYPLTLKAVTTGCNQKSNRSPVVHYTEDDAEVVLDELRELGVVAVVHTESGRTERFRHYMRRRFSLSEPQLAILTELMLRGRQQLGELRSRASRMVPVAGLDELRDEVAGLIKAGLARAGGSLSRRGAEVDHALYREGEAEEFPAAAEETPATASPMPTSRESPSELKALKDEIAAVKAEQRERLDAFQQAIGDLQAELSDLKRDLGV